MAAESLSGFRRSGCLYIMKYLKIIDSAAKIWARVLRVLFILFIYNQSFGQHAEDYKTDGMPAGP